MKRSILFFALLLTFYVQAQRSSWQLGFEISPSIYTMLNQSDKNADAETLVYDTPDFVEPRGWAIGFKALYSITENVGIQTGLRYSWGRQDYTYRKLNSADRTSLGTIRTELNYLQVPLMLSWSPESKYSSRFYASIGLAPAVLVAYYEQNHFVEQTTNGLWYDKYVITYKNNTHSVYSNVNHSESSSFNDNSGQSEYRIYNLFNLFVAAEMGMRFELQRGWQFNVALNYYQSLLNPDNVDGIDWSDYKYTRNENPIHYSGSELPTKYERSKTTLLSIGLSLGLIYDFDW